MLELTTARPGFKLSDEILALLLVTKLPRETFNSIIKQLLSDLKNLTTGAVFDCLLTESQRMKPVIDDTSVALAVLQQRAKKPAQKGDRSSKDPNVLCHLPSHALSMHSNAECRTQNPSLQPNRPNPTSRLMGNQTPNVNAPTSRGLAAISMLSNSEKARLFDHLQNSQVNSATSQPASNAVVSPSSPGQNSNDHVVYFANAYSAIAQSSNKSDDIISDSEADRFIFHSLARFVNLRPVNPVSIKTADGSCHMTSAYAGDAIVGSFAENQIEHQILLPNTLYCPEISINLISASR